MYDLLDQFSRLARGASWAPLPIGGKGLTGPRMANKTNNIVDGILHKVVDGSSFVQKSSADWYIAAGFALAIPVARFLLDRYVFERLGRRVLKVPAYKKSDDPDYEAKLVTLIKWKESAYKCCMQILFTAVLLCVAVPQRWFTDSKLFWAECTRLPCDAPVSLGERLAYCLMLGFYTQAVPMLFLWETKRKDRLEVFAHHIATIVLIAYSYYLNLTRVGVMVLVLHEANDIFLEAAKMLKYADAKQDTERMLIVFVVSWFATRVFIYPLYIIRSTLFESKVRATELGVSMEPHYTILNGFLIFLYLLHVYWSYLIVRIAIRQYTHGDAGDIREEDEGGHKTSSVSEVPSDVSISRLPANAS